MHDSLDRDIERWARKLILVSDGEVRKLTDKEVKAMVQKSRPKASILEPRPRPVRKSKAGAASMKKGRKSALEG